VAIAQHAMQTFWFGEFTRTRRLLSQHGFVSARQMGTRQGYGDSVRTKDRGQTSLSLVHRHHGSRGGCCTCTLYLTTDHAHVKTSRSENRVGISGVFACNIIALRYIWVRKLKHSSLRHTYEKPCLCTLSTPGKTHARPYDERSQEDSREVGKGYYFQVVWCP
jgi:hypothetical protein